MSGRPDAKQLCDAETRKHPDMPAVITIYQGPKVSGLKLCERMKTYQPSAASILNTNGKRGLKLKWFTSGFWIADTKLISLLIPLIHKMTNPQFARRLQAGLQREVQCSVSLLPAGCFRGDKAALGYLSNTKGEKKERPS